MSEVKKPTSPKLDKREIVKSTNHFTRNANLLTSG